MEKPHVGRSIAAQGAKADQSKSSLRQDERYFYVSRSRIDRGIELEFGSPSGTTSTLTVQHGRSKWGQ